MTKDDLSNPESQEAPPEGSRLTEAAASEALAKALRDLTPESSDRSLGDLLGGLTSVVSTGSPKPASSALAGLDLKEIAGKRGGKKLLVNILVEKLHVPQQTAEILAATLLQAFQPAKESKPRRRKETTSRPKPSTQAKPKRPSSQTAKKESGTTKRKSSSSSTKKTTSSTKKTSSSTKKSTSSSSKKTGSSSAQKPSSASTRKTGSSTSKKTTSTRRKTSPPKTEN